MTTDLLTRHRPGSDWHPPPELGRPRHRRGHPLGHDRFAAQLMQPMTRQEFFGLSALYVVGSLAVAGGLIKNVARYGWALYRLRRLRRQAA